MSQSSTQGTGAERDSDVELSIVSLTWNSMRYVEAMVESVLNEARHGGVALELIVVDNGSSDGTLQCLQDLENKCSELKVVPLGRNTGTTFSRNIGLRMCRGNYVLILDSDTQIAPGTLRMLLGARESLPSNQVGLIAPKLTFPDGEFQESARRFPTLKTKLLRLFGSDEARARDESIPEVLAGETTKVDYAISAAWLLPRQTLRDVGLLDEDIFYAPEDVDYCARIWANGLEIWYWPEVAIVHDCQRITRKKPFSRLAASHAWCLVKFWSKYRLWFERSHMRPGGVKADIAGKSATDRAQG